MARDMIAYDLDGCIMDTLPWLCKFFLDKYNMKVEGEGKSVFDFDMPDSYDLSNIGSDIDDAILKHQHEIKSFRSGHHGVMAITTLFQMTPIFLTARSAHLREITSKWLDAHIDAPYQLIMVDSHADKEKAMEDYGLTHFVEDRCRTINQIAPHLTKVYCIKHSYNQGRPFTSDNVVVVDDMWGVFRDMCNNIINREG